MFAFHSSRSSRRCFMPTLDYKSIARAERYSVAASWLACSLRRGLEKRADLVRIFGRRRIVDHHVEIGPAIDREGRKFHRERPGGGMVQDFHAIAMPLHIIVTPHRREFWTCRAQLIDQRLHVARRAGARHIGAKRGHHKPRNALPVGLRRANARCPGTSCAAHCAGLPAACCNRSAPPQRPCSMRSRPMWPCG